MHTIIWKGTKENFIKLIFLSGKTPERSEGSESHCWSSLMESNFLRPKAENWTWHAYELQQLWLCGLRRADLSQVKLYKSGVRTKSNSTHVHAFSYFLLVSYKLKVALYSWMKHSNIIFYQRRSDFGLFLHSVHTNKNLFSRQKIVNCFTNLNSPHSCKFSE